MTDLAAQILAALDRAEETAQAATPGPWEENRGDIMGESEWSPYVSRLYLHAESAGNAAHIAANDPAHVLRLTTALREVVKLHGPGADGDCPTCWNDDDEYELPHRERFPCPTLLALASVWDVPGDNT